MQKAEGSAEQRPIFDFRISSFDGLRALWGERTLGSRFRVNDLESASMNLNISTSETSAVSASHATDD
jgi:hypothetical protein